MIEKKTTVDCGLTVGLRSTEMGVCSVKRVIIICRAPLKTAKASGLPG